MAAQTTLTTTITVYRDEIYGGWLATFPNGTGEGHCMTISEARDLVTQWWGCTNWRRLATGVYAADTDCRVA